MGAPVRLRLWLNRGEAVRWKTARWPVGVARLDDNGETGITELRIDRRSLVNGLSMASNGCESTERVGWKSRRI
jgi:hypothetical protein